MKKIYNYILVSVLAFASAGCVNEEFYPDQPSAESGDEVKFGLSLGDPETRTIYGDETTIKVEQADGTTITKTVFPIYWIDGDKVQVFSPQCLEGRRSAEYKVVLPSGVTNNYADDLTPTGANGVQWGGNATADFYSLYPSGSYTLSGDGTKAENITIGYTQSISVNGTKVKSDMEDCLMYAKTTGVSKGETVNLHYDPISTVIMLTLKVAANETGTDADSFTIQTISLIADTDIAGTFNLNISDGTFEEFKTGKSSKTITTQIVNTATGGYHTLTNGQYVTVPLFLAPAEYTSVKDWKVQVDANGNTYTKTLGINKPLEPGQIHKITLPELKPATTEWDVSKWMTYIPRNVYLSEVSIPGSWNSINPDFQDVGSTDSETIANQYAQGVRAFHLDARWKAEYSGGFLGMGQTVKVVGLGVADGGENGSATSSLWTSGDKYMRGSNTPLVEDIISQLVGYIKTTPQEYMVLVCSFAQESINYEGTNGYWYGEISAICNKSDYADYIVDGRTINANTLVGDVLGKILVIVNMQESISNTTTLPSGSKCVFTYMPSELTSTRFSSSDNETLLKNNSDNLWYSGTTATASGITMYNNQAQITSSTGSGISHDRGYAPSVTERSAVLNGILNWSKSNYGTENYAHDKWIYLGLGGYQVNKGDNAGAVDGSYSTIASTYNTWINGKVTEMGTTPSGQTTAVPYYPVGIVLMNYVNDYVSTVKNILLLNNKYRLQYDSSKPSDYVAPVMTAAASYSSGMQDTGTSAFGWE